MTRQLDRICDRLQTGARRLSERWQRSQESTLFEVKITRLSCAVLGELMPEQLGGDGDRVAGVSCGVHGLLNGTAVFAMEPEDAFTWIHTSDACADPIARFVERGEQIIAALVGAAERAERRPSLSPGRLREESLMEILVATHAPSDTLVLSAQLEIGGTQATLPASFHLMIAPKLFHQLELARSHDG